MNKGMAMAGGLGLGASLMYLFDPAAGKRRRSYLRDKCVHYSRKTEKFAGSKVRHMRNKAKGMMHEMKGAFTPDETTG